MTLWQMERVINKKYRILLRNLIVGINADVKNNNVLKINPTKKIQNMRFFFLSVYSYENIVFLQIALYYRIAKKRHATMHATLNAKNAKTKELIDYIRFIG